MIPAPPPAVERVLSDPQNGATFGVRPGERLQVRLADRGASGTGWAPVERAPGITVSYRGFRPDRVGPAGRPAPDAAGEQVFDVQVLAPAGRTVALAFAHRMSAARLSFARVWRVRLHIDPAPASLPAAPR